MRYTKTTMLGAFLALTFLLCANLHGQEPPRLDQIVDAVAQQSLTSRMASPVIFAGSSRAENWKHLPEIATEASILDHGIEGFQTSDLVTYANELLLWHEPSKIFIYNGDNDLAAGKSVDIVLADMKTLIHVIRRKLPDTPIYLISPKPSIARMHLRPRYEELNYLMQLICMEESVTFVNIWNEMIDEYGDVKKDLFNEDGLHMNEAGHKIWARTIAPHLN